MKLKVFSISFLALTILFSALAVFNVFNDTRSWYESELETTHQALLDNLEFQDELESYGDRYNAQQSLTESSEDALRDWMWECQKAINEYEQNTLIFGLLAGVCGITTVVLIIISKKRKV